MWINELRARIGLCRGLLRQIENDTELDPRDPAVVKLTHIIHRRLKDLEALYAEDRSSEGGINGLGEYFLMLRPGSKNIVA